MIPHWIRLTHRGMQIALSFVAAMMLGVGMLHMLPHALNEAPTLRRLRPQSANSTVRHVDGRRLPHDVFHRAVLLLPPPRRRNRPRRPRARARGSVRAPSRPRRHAGAAPRWGSRCTACSKAWPWPPAFSTIMTAPATGRARHVPGDLPAQAVRLDDDRHADGPRRLVAAGGGSIVNGLFALAIPLGAVLVLAGLATGANSGVARRVRAGLFRGHVPVHFAQRSAAGAAVSRPRPRQAFVGPLARPGAGATASASSRTSCTGTQRPTGDDLSPGVTLRRCAAIHATPGAEPGAESQTSHRRECPIDPSRSSR